MLLTAVRFAFFPFSHLFLQCSGFGHHGKRVFVFTFWTLHFPDLKKFAISLDTKLVKECDRADEPAASPAMNILALARRLGNVLVALNFGNWF